MNAARAYRRLKEVEEKKLQNRLALLRNELAKSQQKIKETQNRTKAVREHQVTLAEKQERHIKELTRRATITSGHSHINIKSRIAAELHRKKQKENIQQKKLEFARKTAAAKRLHRQEVDEQRAREHSRAQMMRKRIQEQRRQGLEKRIMQEQRKREEARRHFNEKVKMEAAKSLEAENKVKRMEQEEMQLIAMLEKAQECQRGVYHELEDAVRTTRTMVEQHSARQRQRRLEDKQMRNANLSRNGRGSRARGMKSARRTIRGNSRRQKRLTHSRSSTPRSGSQQFLGTRPGTVSSEGFSQTMSPRTKSSAH